MSVDNIAWPAPEGEDSGGAYNAGVFMETERELIGGDAEKRLQRLPLVVRALVNGLVQRIINLRSLHAAQAAEIKRLKTAPEGKEGEPR